MPRGIGSGRESFANRYEFTVNPIVTYQCSQLRYAVRWSVAGTGVRLENIIKGSTIILSMTQYSALWRRFSGSLEDTRTSVSRACQASRSDGGDGRSADVIARVPRNLQAAREVVRES